jgi:hypothetical protein
MTVLVLHFNQLLNHVTILKNLFDSKRFTLSVIKLNLLEHVKTLGSDKFFELYRDCLKASWLILVQLVE